MSETFELSADDNRAWRLAPATPARPDEAPDEVVVMLRPRRIAATRTRTAAADDFAEPQGGWQALTAPSPILPAA